MKTTFLEEFISISKKDPTKWGSVEIEQYCRFVAMKEKDEVLSSQPMEKMLQEVRA